jgi:hypothetical protein
MGTFSNEAHSHEYVYDFAVDGGAIGAIDLSAKANSQLLSAGCLVKAVYARVVTAFTSGGAATVSWGPSADVDGYSGAAKAMAAMTLNAAFSGEHDSGALLTGGVYPVVASNSQDLKLTIATAALTAGKLVIVVEYYKPSV